MRVLQPKVSSPLRKKSHPSTQVMVDNALKSLNERNGCSLQAVKKFIANTYSVDTEASSNRIKKYIRYSLESGKFVKTTGVGLAGSFKISPTFKQASGTKIKLKLVQTKKNAERFKPNKDAIAEKKKIGVKNTDGQEEKQKK